MAHRITKKEMARILSACQLSGFYRKDVTKICQHYTWQELKDCYDQIDEAYASHYN